MTKQRRVRASSVRSFPSIRTIDSVPARGRRSRETLPSTPNGASLNGAGAAPPARTEEEAATRSRSTTVHVDGNGGGLATARRTCPTCGERYPQDFRVCPRDATELKDDKPSEGDPLLGSILTGSYELHGIVGEGAMGRVYEGRHTRLRSMRYAIKVLHAELTRQHEVVERFLREAEATAGLVHPNIVAVADVNVLPDGRPYIVAELLTGEHLGALLERRGKLSVSEAVHLCRQVCNALAYAHSKGIVHRDIKPENLFLTGEDGRTVKVLDFGISHIDGQHAQLTKAGVVLGTPAYMPPEQATGSRIDHRADVYSLGAILYELLTGERPFDDPDPVTTLAAVVSKEPRRPRELSGDLPLSLELLIQKAMAKSPKERFQSMLEFEAALADFDVLLRTSSYPPAGGLARISDAPALAPVRMFEMHGPSSLPSLRWSAFLVRKLFGKAAGQLDDARLELLAASFASMLSAALLLISVSTSVVRLFKAGEPLRGSEISLAVFASAGLLVTPALLWTRHLADHVWPTTPRVLNTTASLCRVLFGSLVAYAASMLLVRVLFGAIQPLATSTAWATWDVLGFTAASAAGLYAAWHKRQRTLR
jgi:serine/threonine protein kinase